MKIGIIGAGSITGKHVKGLDSLKEEAVIKAVCDINTEAAEALAGGAGVYSDYRDMLEKEEIDAALICLPHFLHCPVGLDVLNAGVHLFIEKPMALNECECSRLIEAAAKNGKQVFVGQTHQYRSVFVEAKKLIKSGAIGEPRIITSEVIAYYNWETREPWFLDPAKAGGGALFNTAPHQADHMLFLIDSKPKAVRASVSALRPGQAVDSDSVAFIEYENGVRGVMSTFQGTRLEESGRLNVKVLGMEGSIQFNPFGNEIELAKLDKVEKIQGDPALNPFTSEWKEFIASVREGREGASGGIYGHNVVALLRSMVDSSEKHSEVKPAIL
jgi:predicted dehydrogenase